MAWTSPLTWVDGVMATSAQFNAHLRDNMLASEAGVATASFPGAIVATAANAVAMREWKDDVIETAEGPAGASYGNISGGTVGPTVTLTTGTRAAVWYSCQISNTTANQSTRASVAVSGATTVAASDNWSIFSQSTGANIAQRMGGFRLFTGLTAGSNTFTMQYLQAGGTSSFSRRRLQVLGL